MTDNPHRYEPTRHDRTRHKPPCTWSGLAVYAAAALAVPLTLFALAHPAVVAAALLGAAAGLLARPLYRTSARRLDRRRATGADPLPETVGYATTDE